MAKFNLIQTNFASGIFSPVLDGRVDLARYYNSAKILRNWTVLSQGGIQRTPGTNFIAKAKYPDEQEFGANQLTNPDFNWTLAGGASYGTNGVDFKITGLLDTVAQSESLGTIELKGSNSIVSGNYVYIALLGGVITSYVKKLNISDLSVAATSGGFNGRIYSIFVLGNYVYIGTDYGYVYKLNIGDLSTEETSADLGARIRAIYAEGSYVYTGKDGGNVYKLNIADLSTDTSRDIGTTVYSLFVDGSYLYAGNSSGYVYKLNISDLSAANQSSDLGGDIYGLFVSGSYVYAGSNNDKVYKLNVADLSTSTISADLGRDNICIFVSGDYLYVGNADDKVHKLAISDLSEETTSANLEFDIRAVSVLSDYVYALTAAYVYKLNKDEITTASLSQLIVDMDAPLVLGSKYRLGFTLSDYVKGSVKIYCGGVLLGTVSSNKAWAFDFTVVDEEDPLLFYSDEASEFTIGSVSLREITSSELGTVRLIPFQFSVIQGYDMEFGNEYIRFIYKDAGQIIWDIDDVAAWATTTEYVVGDFVKTGDPLVIYRCKIGHTSDVFADDLAAGKWFATDVYEIPSPYLEEDLGKLQFAQEADKMWITHPKYKTMELSRTGHTAWTLTKYEPNEDPFSPEWATSIEYVIGDCVEHVEDSGDFYICLEAHTAGVFATDLAADKWAVSLANYPSGVTIGQGRIWFGGTYAKPQTLWGSVGGSYNDMDKGGGDVADDAIEFALGSNDVNIIHWLSFGKSLIAGTSGGVFNISGGSNEAITPLTPPLVNYETGFGVFYVKPQKIGSYLYYLQDDEYTVREFKYSLADDGFSAIDMSVLAQLMVMPGIKWMAFQQSPIGILWCGLNDGKVGGFTRKIEHEVSGWWTFETDGDVESGCSLGAGDSEVVLAIKRRINNQDVRYIERVAPFYFDDVEDAINTHSTLSLNDPKTIQLIEEDGDNLVFTSTAHGFEVDDTLIFNQIEGMTELNRQKYVVTAITDNTFTVAKEEGETYSEYEEGGLARKCVSSIVAGLDHLEGMEVDIVTDGAVHPRQTVVDGAITLDYLAGLIHIGLPYESYGQLNRVEVGGGGQMTSQGLIKRVISATTRFYQSGITGIRLGGTETQDFVSPIPTTQPEGLAVELFTGDKTIPHPGHFETDGYVVIRQTLPLPAYINCVVRKVEINEG